MMDSTATGGSREIFNQENKTILSKILLKQYNYEEMRFILDYMESIKKNIYNNPNIQGYIYHIGSSTNLVNTMNIKYKKINDLLVSNNSSNNIVEKNILCLFYEKTENNYVTNIKNINDIKEISFDFILKKLQVDYKIVLQTEPQLNLDKCKIIELIQQ